MTDLIEGMREVFEDACQDYMKYRAFTKKAEREGCQNLAKLFRAIAEMENVLAQNHLRAMPPQITSRKHSMMKLRERKRHMGLSLRLHEQKVTRGQQSLSAMRLRITRLRENL